ncbi:MAG: hydrogenase 2 operon protein HybA [Thiogranum sp.]|nr:hydrogenase 2 operon protein HybA [Thiogranum sp.]
MALNRREFLKASAAGMGGALAADVHAVQREPKKLPPDAVGMLYDSTLCIGCKACMSACKQANGMPPEVAGQTDPLWDTPLETSGRTLNVIKLYQNGSAEQKDRDIDGYAFMKRHCMHCVDPSCVSACPVSAMTKDPSTGIVEHHADRCIGCRYCVYSCPFGIPKYEYDDPFGQIQKCEFCSHLQAEGKMPACCDVCPTGASLFGRVDDLQSEVRRRLQMQPGDEVEFPRGKLGGGQPGHTAPAAEYIQAVYGEKELGGTQILYLSAVPFEKLGLPVNVPDVGYPAISEGIQHMLYKWMLIPALLLAGLTYVVQRNIRAAGHDSDTTPDKTSDEEQS